MNSQAIVFENVKKNFGDFKALRDLSFSVNEGELYGLIGPNGAGKTTAIRLLLNLQKATSGRISVLGLEPSDRQLSPLIGYMPQETALYLDLTIQENLELFAKLYGLEKRHIKSKIKELLTFVGLEKWANTVVANLSGGMKHRTSLAVAFLPSPKLLILDEPTVGVDPELRQNFWNRFAEMQKTGTTILITTHYMDEAAKCHRVGLINHGKMIDEDSPSKLLAKTGKKNLEDAFLFLTKKIERKS